MRLNTKKYQQKAEEANFYSKVAEIYKESASCNQLCRMATSTRAPKQWCLTRDETLSSFQAWKQNLLYILSLDLNFKPFLEPGVTWTKKTSANPTRGLTSDGNDIQKRQRRTANEKAADLHLMLGQIANFCLIIARNTFEKNSHFHQ